MTWNLIDRSLCQLRGVSREAERSFCSAGVTNVGALQCYLEQHGPSSLLKRVDHSVEIFYQARRIGLVDVIVNMFPVGMRTRVISDCYERALFFDVETDGSGSRSSVTLISACMNGMERVYVRGVDLVDFLQLWREAEVIVSFNGKRFDVPVLMREFGVSRIPAHIDLMDEGRQHGLRGGLKEIEKKIGFIRDWSPCRNGLDAVQMWRNYCHDGCEKMLDALKRYNLEDSRSLVALYRYLLPLATEGLAAL